MYNTLTSPQRKQGIPLFALRASVANPYLLFCTSDFMDCPACHTANAAEAVTCTACGGSLPGQPTAANSSNPSRRRNGRRRNTEASEAAAVDSNNPSAWRAYRTSLWSIVPGAGLLLGPLAMLLGWRAVRDAGDDVSARNRAKAAVMFGAGSAVTQWVGIVLMYYGWRG
jgi:hypothetical protein